MSTRIAKPLRVLSTGYNGVMLQGEHMSSVIVRKHDIELMEGEPKTHSLNSNAVRSVKSLGAITGLKGLGFHLVELEPGYESTEFHFHHYEDECVYVLSGEATVTIGDDIFQVSMGDFIGHPARGEAHTMKNTGNDKFVYLVAGQRLAHDIVDYPNLNKRLYINDDSSDLVSIQDIEA